MKRVKVTSHQCDYFHHFKVSSNLYGKYASESRYTNLNLDNTVKLKLILMLLIFIKENEKKRGKRKEQVRRTFQGREERSQKNLHFFTISAGASFSQILQFLVLTMTFSKNFSCLLLGPQQAGERVNVYFFAILPALPVIPRLFGPGRNFLIPFIEAFSTNLQIEQFL